MIDDPQFRFEDPEQFEDFQLYEQLNIQSMHPKKYSTYLLILSMVFDNQLDESIIQAFSLNNICKMALASQDILPETWLGVG